METNNYIGEIWKPIRGWENLYQISNFGRVRSFDRAIKSICKGCIKAFKNLKGYYCVKLSIYGKTKMVLVHRLVAQSFPEICGKWFDGCHVHHKDFNPINNNANNLIILSKKEHIQLHKCKPIKQ